MVDEKEEVFKTENEKKYMNPNLFSEMKHLQPSESVIQNGPPIKKFPEYCQVETPWNLIQFFWTIIKDYRDSIDRVVDFGAGDCRFSLYGHELYNNYIGIEIDRNKESINPLATNSKLMHKCILDVKENFDGCIGNPPYVRHHEIEEKWKEKAAKIIFNETNIKVNGLCNLFVYFMWLSLIRTKDNGIVSLVVPFEWVSRPSSKSLRNFIEKKKWHVSVYKFIDSEKIFPRVMTSTSITIIDKSKKEDKWKFYDIDECFNVSLRKGKTGSGKEVLPYIRGGNIRARRGFSPGSQKIFVLTEKERIQNGININDVVPCVTSFRTLPYDIQTLGKQVFKKYFIDSNEKCWLLKTNGKLDKNTLDYLEKKQQDIKDNWTCNQRETWYEYAIPTIPKILYSAGFVGSGPKVMRNVIKAAPVGSISGIIGDKGVPNLKRLMNYIRKFDFESRIVHHSNNLKKIEVNQMNWVIKSFLFS